VEIQGRRDHHAETGRIHRAGSYQFVDLGVECCGSDSESIDEEPGLIISGGGRVQVPIRGDQVPAHLMEAEVRQFRRP
jgi:hypothetical protein